MMHCPSLPHTHAYTQSAKWKIKRVRVWRDSRRSAVCLCLCLAVRGDERDRSGAGRLPSAQPLLSLRLEPANMFYYPENYSSSVSPYQITRKIFCASLRVLCVRAAECVVRNLAACRHGTRGNVPGDAL